MDIKKYTSRKDQLISYAKGKSVLHLGYVHHDNFREIIESKNWLHNELAEVANDIVGFDYLEDAVDFLRNEYGYVGYHADAMHLEDVKIDKQFDLIICGDLIGHLENPGLMLSGIQRFMHENSLLIITTPNPYSLRRIIKILLKKYDDDWINDELVAWYTSGTLSHLCERLQLKIVERGYYVAYSSDDWKTKLKSVIPTHLQDGLFFSFKRIF